MRAIKHAVLSYGLVSVPVGVATATQRKDLSFKSLHGECGTPIEQHKWCPHCERRIESDEVKPGFEAAKKVFVTLDREKMNEIGAERSALIKIKKFVPFDEVDELQVERSYYLDPNDKFPQGYAILSEAMSLHSVVGIGRQALWGKETPAMIWASVNGALILSPLYCWDEIIPDSEIIPYLGKATQEEIELASAFVAMQVSSLNPQEDLVSHSRSRIDEYIEATMKGVDLELIEAQPAPEPSVNLVEELRESIKQSRAA